MAILFGSLIAIALGQLASLAIWWLANDWALSATTGQSWASRLTLLAVFAWSVISYEIVVKSTQNAGLRILLYYLLVAVCLFFACRPEIEILRKLLTHLGKTARSTEEAVT
jgi:hypothetical protein